jgi:membrane-associated phospholipid phosphatase
MDLDGYRTAVRILAGRIGSTARRRLAGRAAIRPSRRRSEDPWFVLAVGLSSALAAVALVDPLAAGLIGGATGGFRALLKAITSFGEGIEILVGSGVLLLVALGLDPAGASRRVRFGLVRIGSAAAFAFASVAGSGILASLCKNAFGRARPDHMVGGGGIFEVHPLAFRADWASFPSGHATTAAATAVVLALLMPRFARWVLICGGVVAATRVLLDAHFPSDVIAGCAVGASFTLALAHRLADRRRFFRHDRDGRLVIAPAPGAGWTDVLAGSIARRRSPDR